MKTVYVEASQYANVAAHNWFIIKDSQVVSYYPSRAAARAARDSGVEGTVVSLKELEFETMAPIGQELTADYHTYVCPHCHCNLSNGVGEHLQEVNGERIKHDQYQYECLACGGEFGPAISASAKVEKAPATKTREVKHTSNIEHPCKTVWAIADEMKGAKRKEVLAACVEKGIAYYTARTQYQQWLSVQKEMATAVRATLA